MKEKRLEELLQRYLQRLCTPAEEQELMQLIVDPGLKEQQARFIDDLYERWQGDHLMSDAQADHIFDQIVTKPSAVVRELPRSRMWPWYRIAVAAIAAAVLVAALYWFFIPATRPVKPDQLAERRLRSIPDRMPPAGTLAILTLANGTKIAIDSVGAGIIARDGNAVVQKTEDGQIVYEASGKDLAVSNTLTVPNGSRPLSLILGDGTVVWLNAGSGLTYPASFSGRERRVSFSGEVYFEVAHNADKPFVVKKTGSDISITVLGTHFNVNGYDDEAAVRVTLLEGSVKVTTNGKSNMLKPRQQAAVNGKGISVLPEVDLETVIAWKNGKFKFDNADIASIMRQLARSYNIMVKYKGNIMEKFGGTISRSVNLSEVLNMLEATGEVIFSMDGNQILVEPAK